MTFFGLTALGPQNVFATTATTYRYLQVFEEEDFKAAWVKVNKESKQAFKSNLTAIFTALFHGPIPDSDSKFLANAFDEQFETPSTISYESFIKIMIRLRDDARAEERKYEGKPKPACEYISSSEFEHSIKKNAAIKHEVQTKQTAPLTSSQEFGWQKTQLQPPIAGRGGSDITKFAAELIKNGIYY